MVQERTFKLILGGHVTKQRVKLLMVSGAVGHNRSGNIFIADEQARKLEGLPTKFDTTLAVKDRGARSDLTSPLPQGINATWISAYRSKWHLLTPKRFLALKKDVKEADAFLTFLPALDGLAPLLLAFLARKPRYVLMIASPIHFRHDARGGWATAALMRALVNACALIATRVLVNGKALAEDLLPPLRRKATDIVLSSLSADDIIPPREPDPKEVRLLCVCRLVPSKRVDIVVEATRLLVERGVNAHLDVVGDGPLRDVLVKLAEDLGIQDRVRFPGWIGERKQLRDCYATANFFLLATETEGISLSIQEAMAAGIPVVSTSAGGLRDFLVNGEDSIVVENPTPPAFAEAVQLLLEDPTVYMHIAKGAQEKVSRLTNQTWVQKLDELVNEDLG